MTTVHLPTRSIAARIARLSSLLRLLAATLAITPVLVDTSAAQDRSILHRAPTPDWSHRDDSDVFFKNAFREGLRGQRPKADNNVHQPGNGDATGQLEVRWSDLISARTLEDEVKRVAGELRTSARRASQLSGPTAVEAAYRLEHLASLFGIISKYDEEVRWRTAASTVGEKLSAWSDEVAQGEGNALEAASWEMDGLLRGSPPAGETSNGQRMATIASRSAVMHRLDHAVEVRLRDASSSPRAFRRQSQTVVHEAEMVAVLARLLTLDGAEDAADDDYRKMCEDLMNQALNLRESAEQKDLEMASQHLGEIKRSCAACHEMYRG